MSNDLENTLKTKKDELKNEIKQLKGKIGKLEKQAGRRRKYHRKKRRKRKPKDLLNLPPWTPEYENEVKILHAIIRHGFNGLRLVDKTKYRPLNPRQEDFIQYYTDRNSPTYGNAVASYQQAYPGVSKKQARWGAKWMMKRPGVKDRIRDLLGRKEDDMPRKLYRMMHKFVDKHEHDPRPAMWAAEYYAKIMGEFAPETHATLVLTPEQRRAELAEIAKLIAKSNALPQPETNEAGEPKENEAVATEDGTIEVDDDADQSVA